MMLNPIFPAWLVCILLLFDAGLSFPPHFSCSAFASTHQESEGFVWQRSLTGWDAVPLSSQGNHYGQLLPFPSPHAAQGGIFGSYAGLLMVADGTAGSLAETSVGAATSVGTSVGSASPAETSVGAASSVGSSVGSASLTETPVEATSFVGTSAGASSLAGSLAGASWVFTGTTPKVQHPPGWPDQRKPHMVPSPSSILACTLPKCVVSLALVGGTSPPNTVGLVLEPESSGTVTP